MNDLTPEDMKNSAQRVAREPWMQNWLKGAYETTLDRLYRAETHEDLLRAQAWHQAVDMLSEAMRKASKT